MTPSLSRDSPNTVKYRAVFTPISSKIAEIEMVKETRRMTTRAISRKEPQGRLQREILGGLQGVYFKWDFKGNFKKRDFKIDGCQTGF